MTLYPKLILDALATVRYPGTGKNLVEAEMVADNLRIDGMSVSFSLIFEKPTDPFMKSMIKAAETAIHTYVSPDVQVAIVTESRQAARPEPGKLLPLVRDLIVPIEKYGIKLLSIGFFVDPDQATLWRGGMASNALKQLIGDAAWGELDYFILDTPPGTSDIHLTLVQTLAITGAVIVSTPQQVALADARKGINMYTNDKVNVPILGLVENMSWFTPAELPENKYYLFGKEGCKQLAEEMNVPLLGQIPIVQSICENGDKGTPAALNEDSITGRAFIELAENVVKQTEKRNAEQAPTHIVEMKK